MSVSLNDHIQDVIRSEIQRLQLPDDFVNTVECYYLPLAEHLANEKKAKKGTLLASINGSQGSGKTTLTSFVSQLLKQHFQLNAVAVSIDDFYLTRKQRHRLAKEVHPLFQTRGVPGTHDIYLAQQTLSGLMHCSATRPCNIPVFDKSIDDRAIVSVWHRVQQHVDIILFEGWCNNAPLQTGEELEQSINELEKVEDKYGIWRRFVNDQLAWYQQKLFNRTDLLIYLQIPDFQKVYEWRGLQEKKLTSEKKSNSSAVMNADQLRRFIQHYERITRHCLLHLPAMANVLLKINNQHQVESMRVKGQQAE